MMFGALVVIATMDGKIEELIGILFGMLIGIVVRDVATCRLTSRLWPFTRELLDWETVEKRFEELA